MLTQLRRLLPGLAVVAGLALPIVVSSCDKVPLLAPTGTVINLFAGTNSVSLNSNVEIIATAIENGTDTGGGTNASTKGAGTPVQNGTVISFTTTLGRIEPSEARTHNGEVRVRFITTNQSGTATITAFSGGASKAMTLSVGTAAARTIAVTAVPSSLGPTGGTVTLSAVVVDQGGAPIGGIPVTFATDQGSLSSATATTDANGVATTTLTTTATATVTVNSGGATPGTVKVNVGVRSIASITANPQSTTAGTPVIFSITPAANTTAPNVTVDFGDGDFQNVGTITGVTTIPHPYGAPGTYTATARAGDGTSASTTVLVGALGVTLTASPTTTAPGTPITFTATGAPAAVQGFSWFFDDGAVLSTTANQVVHAFQSRGNHVARVDVIGIGGGVIGTATTVVAIQ